MTKSIKTLLVVGLSVTAIGCSGAQEKTQITAKAQQVQTVKSKPHAGYSKPSAAIDFRHDYSGVSQIGVVETVNLKVLDRYEGGTMEVTIIPSDGVQVFGNQGATTFKMDGESIGDLNLQFQSNQEGIHNISVIAKATLANGQLITRSYSLPVHVGEKFRPTKQSLREGVRTNTDVQQRKPNGGIIIMDAEEVID